MTIATIARDLMGDAYREEAPPTRAEFNDLTAKVQAVLKRKPRAPFVLRLWHTFTGGVIALLAGIYGIGWVYDHFETSGTKISLYLMIGLIGAVGFFMAVCSLFAIDSSWREGLRSPWRRDD